MNEIKCNLCQDNYNNCVCSFENKESPDIKQKYVGGFLFSSDKKKVWLIQKCHPVWQLGKANCIGGKIEKDESPDNAMKREFLEETGVEINDWKQYLTLTDNRDYVIHFYYAFSDKKLKTMTDEEVILVEDVNNLPPNIIPNLYWMIPMALYDDKFKYYVSEK